MAYGEKYYRSFYDRFDNLWKIEFLFKDYTGAQSEFIGAGEPLEIMCEDSNGDPFSPIKTKSVRVGIVARTFQQYIDLQNASLYQVQCKVYKNGNLYFQGWNRPDEYSEEVQNQAHIVTVTAVCGLTLLKDIAFDPDLVIVPYSALYKGILTAFDVVRICLISTNITLTLLDGVDIFPINDDVVPDESFTALKQYYAHRGSLRESNGYKDCYTILSNLLQSKSCHILQEYVAGAGLCWLIRPIRTLDAVQYFRVIDLTTQLEESAKLELNPFVTVTNAQGYPMTVITDLSGVVQIQNTPGKLILTSDPEYDENLIKDSYEYRNSRLDQVTELDMEENQLKIIPIPATSHYITRTGIEFQLGSFRIALAETLTISFKHTGDCKFEAGLVFYNEINGITYVWRDDKKEFYPISLTTWSSFYTYNGNTTPADTNFIRYGEQDVTYTFTPTYFPTSNDLDAAVQGRFVLIFRASSIAASGRSPAHRGAAYLDLDSLSAVINTTPELDIEGADVERIYNDNTVKKEIDFLYSDSIKYPRSARQQTPWQVYNFVLPNFSFKNTFLVHDGVKALYVEKWKLEGVDTKYGLMQLLLVVYDKIYSQNRLKLSADILGQINLSSILVFQDVVMLIDRWSLRVKSGIQSVNLIEIGKYEDWLVTESDSGVMIFTESDSDYILIEN